MMAVLVVAAVLVATRFHVDSLIGRRPPGECRAQADRRFRSIPHGDN